MSNKTILALAAILFAGVASCQKTYTPETPESVALYTHSNPKAQSVDGGTQGVTITATADWTATSNVDWITVSPAAGGRGINEVILTYSANTTGVQRTGTVTFSSSTNSEVYTLIQAEK